MTQTSSGPFGEIELALERFLSDARESPDTEAFETALALFTATLDRNGAGALVPPLVQTARSTPLEQMPPALMAICHAWIDGEQLQADVAAMAMDQEIAAMFVAEALDHLGTIEAVLLQLEDAPTDKTLLNDVFRPFHTIKGNAGAIGVTSVQEFAHKVENLLDRCRSGAHVVGSAEIDVVLKSVDLLTAMIRDLSARASGAAGRSLRADRLRLMASIEQLITSGGSRPELTAIDSVVAAAAADADFFAVAPASVPTPSDATAGPTSPDATADPAAIDLLPTPVVSESNEPASDAPARIPTPARTPAASAPAPVDHAPRERETTVKVDTRKLDGLVDTVGELVILQSLIYDSPALAQVVDEKLARNLAQLRRITTELQRGAMSMRMVPIRQTFQKMARLVRDLGKMSGKQVELQLAGEDTELDRKVVEDINDPLMHMVRNSVDHGLEPNDARTAAGKPRAGRLCLRAFHQSGNVVIQVADDGAGLKTDRILAKARTQGLVQPGESLSPSEIHQLIFRPGFSTAEKVTEISGRGVGMDVVRRNIEALRGRIDIESTPGAGTTFSIKLPLTLAILDGLVVAVGSERFVIPTFAVRESLRPLPSQVHSVQGTPRMVQVRDRLLPLLWLSDFFNLESPRLDPTESTVVVLEEDHRRVGLVVDALIGKQEVVVKPLGETFAGVKGVEGGAILGDGRVGLILDAHGIVKDCGSRVESGRAEAA